MRKTTLIGCTALAAAGLIAAHDAAAGTASAAPTEATAVKPHTVGLAITSFPYAINKGANDCPDGLAMAAKQIYLAATTPTERARLTKPENLKEFEQKAYHTPDGRDLCQVPDYPRAPQATPQTKISYGENLDGTTDGHATETTCAHEKFTAPDGTASIDNQSYRVLGCSSNYRGFPGEEGYLESLRNASYKDGGTTMLIEVQGVTDGKNDAVEVGFYNGATPMMIDANGHMLPYASLTVTGDKKLQSHMHGKLVNGVLTTEPADIALQYDFGGYPSYYHFKASHLRLTLKPDGSASGMLTGYLDAKDIDLTPHAKQESAEMIGYDCPTFAQAVRRFADGFKDPKTGQCTALSTAFNIEAIPAFVIHPDDAHKTAEATQTQAH
ncbi:MAG TPA: hypothetical protein VL899_11150 [Alphaproteobacteria bacterium]|nr:hypothetical protein [Alphaproteobacteria bacterium]